MKLTNYKYGNTEFAIDLSKIRYIAKGGSKNIVIVTKYWFDNHLITFTSADDRDKAYSDILGDINELNKPIANSEILKTLIVNDPYKTYEDNKLRGSVMTKPTALNENPYLYTDPALRMKKIETERDDKRYCSTCAHLGESGWLCFEECSNTYHDAWIPKL